MGTYQRRGTIGLVSVLLPLAALAQAVPVVAQPLEITRGESRMTRQAPADNFSGLARVDRLFERLHGASASGGLVAFEPGARTAWHAHPGGQTLVVTAGTGRVQRWGDAVQEIRTGDVVRIPPGQKHWHGASPGSAMTHLAITESRDGSAVQWMEHVTDEQYQVSPQPERPAAASSVAEPVRPVAAAQGQQAAQAPQAPANRPSGELQQRLAPGLANLTDEVLYGDVWRRTALSPRDRSLVTIATLIATGKTAQLPGHLARGLENGLQPRETSGMLAQLAVYCGWPSAVSALPIYEQVYAARKVDASTLLVARSERTPSTGAERRPTLDASVAAAAPKFAQLTDAVVFGDLWLRTDLAPRDRSLVTLAAIASQGDHEQLDAHVRRGLDNGLTRTEIAEAFAHLAFYAGWSKASQALAVMARATDR